MGFQKAIIIFFPVVPYQMTLRFGPISYLRIRSNSILEIVACKTKISYLMSNSSSVHFTAQKYSSTMQSLFFSPLDLVFVFTSPSIKRVVLNFFDVGNKTKILSG